MVTGYSVEEMIKDAMEGWLAVAREEGLPIPDQFESIEVAAETYQRGH